jgi:hypothetical protein
MCGHWFGGSTTATTCNGPNEYIKSIDWVKKEVQCGTLPPNTDCGEGRALRGFEPNGDPICKNVAELGIKCPVGQIMEGLKANGEPHCMELLGPSNKCPAGKFLKGFNDDGTKNCGVDNAGGGGDESALTWNATANLCGSPEQKSNDNWVCKLAGGSGDKCDLPDCPTPVLGKSCSTEGNRCVRPPQSGALDQCRIYKCLP